MKSRLLGGILSIVFLTTPLVSSALTMDEINTQIQSLFAQVLVLQQQITALVAQQTTSDSAHPPTASTTSNGNGTSNNGNHDDQNSTGGTVPPACLTNTAEGQRHCWTEFDTLPTSGNHIVHLPPSCSASDPNGRELCLADIAAQTPPTNPPTSIPTVCPIAFERNLSIGSNGGDVAELQRVLVVHGLVASTSITGYFGPITAEALERFQAFFNIASSSGGVFGPRTRGFLHKLCGPGNGTIPTRPTWWISTTSFPVWHFPTTSIDFDRPTSTWPVWQWPTTTPPFVCSCPAYPNSGNATTTTGNCGCHPVGTTTPPKTCMPRPACLDTTPRCMIPEPASGWCPTSPVACTMDAKLCPDGTYVGRTGPQCTFTCPGGSNPETPVTIYSISPTFGRTGTLVAISGFGFRSNNTILMDGSIAARNVPITSSIAVACTTDPNCHGGIHQGLLFTVPSSLSPNCPSGSMCPMYMRLVTPGTYGITVQNDNGTSNSIPFVVSDNGDTVPPPIRPLTITGLDAPGTLPMGTEGTWTIHTSIPSNSTTNLHYSVTWGDELTAATTGFMAPRQTEVQNSASFTHVYQHVGLFTASFTVTDDNGHSATATSIINVTRLY